MGSRLQAMPSSPGEAQTLATGWSKRQPAVSWAPRATPSTKMIPDKRTPAHCMISGTAHVSLGLSFFLFEWEDKLSV